MSSPRPNTPLPPDLEPLVVSGHPVHTRTLSLELRQQAEGRLRAVGTILDLRKAGFVPTGGDLQTAGFIHHMSLDLSIDAATRVLVRVEPSQSVVAFEPGPLTDGESCRDPIHRLRALEGERLDAALRSKLRAGFGGALGCSHLLTLAMWTASALPYALDIDVGLRSGGSERAPGERVFKRVLMIDGFERRAGDALELVLQQSDFHPFPVARREPGLLGVLAREHEVRLRACVTLADMALSEIVAAERVRTAPYFADGCWAGVDSDLSPLVGKHAMRGLGREIQQHLGDGPDEAPLKDALLNLAPGLIQCMAGVVHRMVELHASGAANAEGDGGTGSPLGSMQMGGFPDSCYIWRSNGALGRIRRGADWSDD